MVSDSPERPSGSGADSSGARGDRKPRVPATLQNPAGLSPSRKDASIQYMSQAPFSG